ncbi:putative sulfate exporter family transporter, partial [Clavibacter michiganensis subsp. insidiosus]
MPATATRLHPALPGLGAAAAAALVAWGVHALVPAIPLLTVAV